MLRKELKEKHIYSYDTLDMNDKAKANDHFAAFIQELALEARPTKGKATRTIEDLAREAIFAEAKLAGESTERLQKLEKFLKNVPLPDHPAAKGLSSTKMAGFVTEYIAEAKERKSMEDSFASDAGLFATTHRTGGVRIHDKDKANESNKVNIHGTKPK